MTQFAGAVFAFDTFFVGLGPPPRTWTKKESTFEGSKGRAALRVVGENTLPVLPPAAINTGKIAARDKERKDMECILRR